MYGLKPVPFTQDNYSVEAQDQLKLKIIQKT